MTRPDTPTAADAPTVREAQPAAGYDATAKQKSQAKTSRIPIKIVPAEVLKKPDWIRVKAGSPTTRFYEIKDVLRKFDVQHSTVQIERAGCADAAPVSAAVAPDHPGHHHDHDHDHGYL